MMIITQRLSQTSTMGWSNEPHIMLWKINKNQVSVPTFSEEKSWLQYKYYRSFAYLSLSDWEYLCIAKLSAWASVGSKYKMQSLARELPLTGVRSWEDWRTSWHYTAPVTSTDEHKNFVGRMLVLPNEKRSTRKVWIFGEKPRNYRFWLRWGLFWGRLFQIWPW